MTVRSLIFSQDGLDIQDVDEERLTFSYYKRAGLGFYSLEILLSIISGGIFYVVF